MNVRQGYPHPIAYTYEASEHCPTCAAARFGVDEDGWIPEDARDSEGNPVGAVAPWDEWERSLVCGTCFGVIREHDDEEENALDALENARAAWSRVSQQMMLDVW